MFKIHFQRNRCKKKNQRQQSGGGTERSSSSDCCCYLASHLNCQWLPLRPLHLPPLPHPSLPGSHRSGLSASSCGPLCFASFSSSSAGQWRWPGGFSAWLHTPASVACNSCVVLVCDGRGWSRSPCDKADASARSGAHGRPGPCGGAVPGSPDTDMGWVRTGSSWCDSTVPRGGRSLYNRGSHSYTVRENTDKCRAISKMRFFWH